MEAAGAISNLQDTGFCRNILLKVNLHNLYHDNHDNLDDQVTLADHHQGVTKSTEMLSLKVGTSLAVVPTRVTTGRIFLNSYMEQTTSYADANVTSVVTAADRMKTCRLSVPTTMR